MSATTIGRSPVGRRQRASTFSQADRRCYQCDGVLAAGLPVVRSIPCIPRGDKSIARVIDDVGTAIAEAYGGPQTNLMFAKVGEPGRGLVSTSAQPGHGKTTSAVKLTLSLAYRGFRALLIDADLRRGAIHSVFGTSRQPGLRAPVLDVVLNDIDFKRDAPYDPANRFREYAPHPPPTRD